MEKFAQVSKLQQFTSVTVCAYSFKEMKFKLSFSKWLFFTLRALSHFYYLSKSLEISLGLTVYHGLHI